MLSFACVSSLLNATFYDVYQRTEPGIVSGRCAGLAVSNVCEPACGVQIPFAYHDGYLSVHFEAHKYQDIKLTSLQEEAVW